MGGTTVVAVDLGAGSGRVVLARIGTDRIGADRIGTDRIGADRIELEVVHRFGTEPVRLARAGGSGLHWDVVNLYREVLTGLRHAVGRLRDGERIASIGIDSWAVDYGLLDARGELLGVPYCYRDDRTAQGVAQVHAVVPPEELYARNGLQFLPFNTLYQLAAEPADRLAAARTMLLLPDLLAYWLTGTARAEVTNASTTGLLDVRRGEWDHDLARRLRLPPGMLPDLVRPGEVVGTLLPQVAEATGLPAATRVVAVGSHDTASAVVGVPADGDRFAYVSCGTWSLVGLELPAPVLDPQARQAGFTNEGGVDGRVRFLHNVMGLWLLSESLRTWRRAGSAVDLDHLLRAAAELPAGGPVFDVDDPVFLPPGDMPARIAHLLGRNAGSKEPTRPGDRPALVRSVLDSLAAAYARAIDDAVRLTGRPVDVVHLVGGGSRNRLLCALTAQATGRPVLAGPVEATAFGNALVQARAVGAVQGDLTTLRALLRASLAASDPLQRYAPDPDAQEITP